MTDITILPEVSAFLNRSHGQFINGEMVANSTPETIEVINPATGEAIARIAAAQQADVDKAVASSRKGFKIWSKTSPAERGNVVHRLADLVEKHSEELAQIETLQSGKIIQMSRSFEVAQAAAFLRYYAGWATKITGETITPSLPSTNGERYTAMTLRQPVGVVVGIVPWNFSIMISVWKFASALVTGCSIIIKPSEFTPLTMLRIAELAVEAGLPAGVLNVLTGNGEVGKALIAHDGTNKVSFTGSVPTGIAVAQGAAGAKLTRATLELGGKNAVAFLDDVSTEKAVNGIIEAAFLHTGQICASAERFYVPRSRLEEIVAALSKALDQIKIGSPLDEGTQFGPVTNKQHLDKLAHYFRLARETGDRIVYGGNVIDRPGFYVEPTVIVAKSNDNPLMNEETFGPIASFLPYDDEDELLSLMNGTPFGLTASIWTNDLSKALRMAPEIEVGTVWINMHTILDPAVPFGGAKSSGIGREFGSAFIEDYTELKSIMIRY
jgi:phenylacetaldehyde dehydrogenase